LNNLITSSNAGAEKRFLKLNELNFITKLERIANEEDAESENRINASNILSHIKHLQKNSN